MENDILYNIVLLIFSVLVLYFVYRLVLWILPSWFAGSVASMIGAVAIIIGFVNDIDELVFEEPPAPGTIMGLIDEIGRYVAIYVCSFAPYSPELIGGLCVNAAPPQSSSQTRPSPAPTQQEAQQPRPRRIPISVGRKGEDSEVLHMIPGLGRIESFKDCPNCPEMVVIPAGSFTTGSPNGRTVTIARPFAIAKHEVTVDQWRACVNAGVCRKRAQPADPNTPGDLPVVNVSYQDARDYAAWLSIQTGRGYKLPTAVQWEYAARSTSTGDYWWQRDEISALYANYRGSEGKGSVGQLEPVDSYSPNFWGLYNVHGNAAEWIHDCAVGDCNRRAVRGGSRKDYADAVTTTARIYMNQTASDQNTGFRVVRDLERTGSQ